MSHCDLPEFYDWSEPVARKVHRCCECDALINKGEKHFHASGKWGGEVSSFRQHLLCMEACMFIRDELNGGDCICFGELREWADESMYSYDRRSPHQDWKKLRSMLAQIKKRERSSRALLLENA